jgi:hypothetical protein
MRRLALNVKRLASVPSIWHLPHVRSPCTRRALLAKDAADKDRIKAARLREALRANLRRRKVKPSSADEDRAWVISGENDPKSAG